MAPPHGTPTPGPGRRARTAAAALCVALAAALAPAAGAHRPLFPGGAGPFAVEDPAVSQAWYVQLPPEGELRFDVPPLAAAEPLQVLVLDDEAGRTLEPTVRWVCGGREEELPRVDTPFYEAFSRMHMRYRVAGAVGPTDATCSAHVRDAAHLGGPVTFAIGTRESFNLGDVWTLLALRDKLNAWKRGE